MQRDLELDKELAKLPLRQNVRWIDLSFLFPGRVVEAVRRESGVDGEGKFGACDLGSPEVAAKVVEYHNEIGGFEESEGD